MIEWKVRQEIYHRLNEKFSDDLTDKHVELSSNIIENAVRYFNEANIGWIYPAKSYMVGICYAKFLSEEFGGTPEDYLKDPTLLYNNDPYFVDYNTDPTTYNEILNLINGWNFNQCQGMVPDVRQYFVEEFMLRQLLDD
jgi:hypothetical protein